MHISVISLIACCCIILLTFLCVGSIWLIRTTNSSSKYVFSEYESEGTPPNNQSSGALSAASNDPKWKRVIDLLRTKPKWKMTMIGNGEYMGDISASNITYEVVAQPLKNLGVGEYGNINITVTGTNVPQSTISVGTWQKNTTVPDAIRITNSPMADPTKIEVMDLQYLSDVSIKLILIDDTRPGRGPDITQIINLSLT